MSDIMINLESLISEVQKHPLLWNHSLKGYKSTTITNPKWNIVAEALQLPTNDNNTIKELKSKFKKIKDRYRVEHNKYITNTPRSGEEASSGYISQWPLYPLCDFMKDLIRPNENTQNSFNENIDNEDSVNISSFMDEVIVDNANELDSSFNSNYDTSVVHAYKRKNQEVKSRREEIESLVLQNETKKLKLISELVDGANNNEPANPDTQFLLSLLSYFEGISKKTNMKLRNAVMNTIVNFFDVHSSEE